MPTCEECCLHATWRNGDGSFACSHHKDGLTAVYLGQYRRNRLADWAKALPDEGEVRLKNGTYLHNALLKAWQGYKRFSDLRDNDQNAGSLQKAMILGFIIRSGKQYFITPKGVKALWILSKAPERTFVKVPFRKNIFWAAHAQTYCW